MLLIFAPLVYFGALAYARMTLRSAYPNHKTQSVNIFVRVSVSTSGKTERSKAESFSELTLDLHIRSCQVE